MAEVKNGSTIHQLVFLDGRGEGTSGGELRSGEIS